MITNTKNKSLIAIIIFLLITNIAVLVFFLFVNVPGKKTHSREDGISTFLKKDIQFDEKQMEAYKTLKDKHIQSLKPVFEEMRSAKDSFYNLLYQTSISDSAITDKAGTIGDKQTYLDVKMLQHFKNVRALCTPDQLPKFDSLFKNVIQRFTHGKFGKSRDSKNNK